MSATTYSEDSAQPNTMPARKTRKTGKPAAKINHVERLAIVLPVECGLPTSERAYSLDVQLVENPYNPTERDLALVERLGSLMCDESEVCAVTGLTKAQLNAAFQPVYYRGRERAKGRLRLMQWDAAAQGSERMLQWLGKQYLQQTERVESTTLDKDAKSERRSFLDKLQAAIDSSATGQPLECTVTGGAPSRGEDVADVGAGQPAAPDA